ncbi:MAG TPA: 2-dehydropantoate 2-reductase [Syntrophales bacterium]|nr:2-dehydropantoate 2-reductase [Syntrophales bacterium]
MRIAVMGMGGVGGVFGAKLAKAYAGTGEHEVVFLARGLNMGAIRRDGLTLSAADGTFTTRPDLVTDRMEEAGPLDLVLFCVKGYSLDEAAGWLKGALREKAVVIPLLNGVDIADRLKAILPEADILEGLVYVSAFVEAPGKIKQVSPAHQIVFGPRDGNAEPYRPIEALLKKAGINATLTDQPLVPLWTKYIFICPSAGLTALQKKTFGEIMENPDSRAFLKGLMEEVEAVARAKGVALPANIVEESISKVAGFPPATKTSLQLDFEKGNPTEIELFNGYIVRAGKELGLPTPLNEKVYKGLTG